MISHLHIAQFKMQPLKTYTKIQTLSGKLSLKDEIMCNAFS